MKYLIIMSIMLSVSSSFAGTCKSRNNPSYSEMCIQQNDSVKLIDATVTCGETAAEYASEGWFYQLTPNTAVGVPSNSIVGMEESSGTVLIICATKD